MNRMSGVTSKINTVLSEFLRNISSHPLSAKR